VTEGHSLNRITASEIFIKPCFNFHKHAQYFNPSCRG
jgi:hypothetical protein